MRRGGGGEGGGHREAYFLPVSGLINETPGFSIHRLHIAGARYVCVCKLL